MNVMLYKPSIELEEDYFFTADQLREIVAVASNQESLDFDLDEPFVIDELQIDKIYLSL